MPYDPLMHFLQLSDWPADRLHSVLELSVRLKEQLRRTGRNDPILYGKTLAMVFEKPSLRTRVSFSVAMTQLGGAPMVLRQDEIGIDTREPAPDIARVLSGMCDGVMIRTFGQERVERLANFSSIPVINGLTDLSHPCQAMADVLTLKEHFGDIWGKTVTYVGDGNNVTRSLAIACGKFGMHLMVASPSGFELPEGDVVRLRAQLPGLSISQTPDVNAAVRQADCVYTDTWVSMGQEAEKAKRVKAFAGFCVDEQLMASAPDHAIVMHCLPAYRGLEISEGVLESARSLVFQQAENRLHVQKGIVAALLAPSCL